MSSRAVTRFTAPLLARAVVVALVAVVAAGCGTGANATPPGVAPLVWAGQVCSALKPWRDKIISLNADAQRKLAGAKTVAQTRAQLGVLLDNARAASETARVALTAAGQPAVDGGAVVADGFVAALVAVRDAYARAGKALAALPTADSEAFYSGVVGVFKTLTDEYAQSAPDTSKVTSVALRAAFDQAPECR